MKYLILLLLILFLIPINSFGCSCREPTSFCESISDKEGNIYPNTIIRGKVVGSSSEGKEIEVSQVIWGDTDRSNFTLTGDFCTLYYNELEENTEYVIALNRTKEYSTLIACAISFLKIEDEKVIGKIAPGIVHMDYEELSDLESCGHVFDQVYIKKNLNIFPNPTSDFISIDNTSSENKFEGIQISIFDPSGREVAKHTKTDGIMPSEDWRIDIRNFVSGLYIVEITNGYQKDHFKVIKI